MGQTDQTTKAPLSHLGFLISMFGKGLLGFSQIIGGIFLAITPPGTVSKLVDWLTHFELAEDPSDPLMRVILSLSQSAPASTASFYTAYLIIHGALNLGLVLALVAKLNWAYPVSIASLTGFVAYQLYKYAHTQDIMMLVLSVIDVVVIFLIWHEWSSAKKKETQNAA